MKKFALMFLLIVVIILGVFDDMDYIIAQEGQTPPRNPSNLEPISVWNVNDIEPLTVMGRGTPRHAAWSRDGQWFAVQTSIGVWLYPEDDLESPPRQLAAERAPILTFTFHPDSRQIATAHPDGEIVVWDIESGEIETVFNSRQQGIVQLAYSPDGSRLASGNHNTDMSYRELTTSIVLWDTDTQEIIKTMRPDDTLSYIDFLFSPTEPIFISDFHEVSEGANEGIVELRDSRTGELLNRQLEIERMPAITHLEFTPDGQRLVGTLGHNVGVQIGNMSTLTIEELPIDTCCWRTHLRVNDHSLFITKDGNRPNEDMIAKYDFATQELSTIVELDSRIKVMDLNPNAELLSYADDSGQVVHVDLSNNAIIRTNRHFYGRIDHLALAPDSTTIFTDGDGFLSQWTVFEGDRVDILRQPTVEALSVSSDGWWLAIGDAWGSVYVWSLTDEAPSIRFRAYDYGLTTLLFSHYGTILATSGTVSYESRHAIGVVQWEITPANTVVLIDQNDSLQFGASALAYSPDDSILAYAEDQRIYIGDLEETGAGAVGFEPPTDRVFASSHADFPNMSFQAGIAVIGYITHMEFSPDGGTVVAGGTVGALGGNYGTPLYFIDTETGLVEERGNWLRFGDEIANHLPINDLSISKDGSLVAVADDDKVRIFSVQRKSLLRVLPIGGNQLEFSQDGRLLVIASGGTVQVWGVPTN